MTFIPRDTDRAFLDNVFPTKLLRNVSLDLFLREESTNAATEAREIVSLIAKTSSKVRLLTHQISKSQLESREFGIDNAPAIIISSEDGKRIYFLGTPSGFEFRVVLEDIIDASTGKVVLPANVSAQISSITEPVVIRVLVTPSCPYCPFAIRTVHKFGFVNNKIHAEAIEVLEFPEVAVRYNVMSTPKIIINETTEFVGALPEYFFVEQIMVSLARSKK